MTGALTLQEYFTSPGVPDWMQQEPGKPVMYLMRDPTGKIVEARGNIQMLDDPQTQRVLAPLLNGNSLMWIPKESIMAILDSKMSAMKAWETR